MAEEKGFSINDPEHIAGHTRENNGWGFTKEDLEKYGVTMITDIRLTWSEETPPEMRQAFGEATHVLHVIAERAIMAQLEHDKLKPTKKKDLLYTEKEGEPPILLRESAWKEL